MLYLEDYLEMIEHLPSELRDRFTEMRETDLSVQNRVDSLEERQKIFFANCRKWKNSDRDEEIEKIRKEYKKVIEEASDKITNAEDCYALVDRYLRKLDQELHKFKLELEADSRGITEILEKRSLEMDAPSHHSHKENRHPKKHARKHPSNSNSSGSSNNNNNSVSDRKASFDSDYGCPGTGTIPLQHMGAGGSDIAAAASAAIQATQISVPGRRSSSLKASYEAIHLGVQNHEFSIGRELAGAAQSALAATAFGLVDPPSTKRQKNKRVSSILADGSLLDVGGVGCGVEDSFLLETSSANTISSPSTPASASAASGAPAPEEHLNTGSSTESEWNYDPSEPRYCICNQVSYGDMVACDNQDCPYEWFHYPCVSISAPPKGKWYCPTCLANMARKKGRK